ncbi:hypothetical protein [Streptosporangium roseum]|uniref:hypothetical protein n=1 Tax=Streptosporangium roseum TaxID=2001 RepID=UPI00331F4FD1
MEWNLRLAAANRGIRQAGDSPADATDRPPGGRPGRPAGVRGHLAGDADRIADAVDDLLELVDQDDPDPGRELRAVAVAEAVAARAVEPARHAREQARVAAEPAARHRRGRAARPPGVMTVSDGRRVLGSVARHERAKSG